MFEGMIPLAAFMRTAVLDCLFLKTYLNHTFLKQPVFAGEKNWLKP